MRTGYLRKQKNAKNTCQAKEINSCQAKEINTCQAKKCPQENENPKIPHCLHVKPRQRTRTHSMDSFLFPRPH